MQLHDKMLQPYAIVMKAIWFNIAAVVWLFNVIWVIELQFYEIGDMIFLMAIYFLYFNGWDKWTISLRGTAIIFL